MGRAPTSGYCHNCRTRRIKCDKAQPHCLQCENSGRQCRGYDLPMRMQKHFVVPDRHGGQRVLIQHNPTTKAISLAATDTAASASPYGATPISSTPEELIFGYFFQNYVWAHFWRPIMHLMHASSERVDVAYTASLAVAAGVKAAQDNDRALKVRALSLYGEAVSSFRDQFSRAIGNRGKLVALPTNVILLSLYNYAVDGDLSLVDQTGVDAILQYCGPELFQEPSLLQTFRTCRSADPLAKGKRTFLDTQEWKTIPWRQNFKTADDKLQDILVHLPAAFVEFKFPTRLTTERRAKISSTLKSLWQQLETWRWEWEKDNSGAAVISTASGHNTNSIEEPTLAKILASRIDMDTVTLALDINLYNAICICISQLQKMALGQSQACKNDRRLSPTDLKYMETLLLQQRKTPLLLPGEAKHPCQYAVEAARLMPYIAEQLPARQDHTALMLSPTGIIFSALKAQPELEEWSWALRSRITYLKGPVRELVPFDIFNYPQADASNMRSPSE